MSYVKMNVFVMKHSSRVCIQAVISVYQIWKYALDPLLAERNTKYG